MRETGPETAFTLATILNILYRGRRPILYLTLVGLLIGVAYAFLTAPLFRATTQIRPGIVAYSVDGGPVRELVIAEVPGSYRWATAEIQGDTLIVRSDRYKHPAAVRYGWADNPYWTNLINKEGLPASPFRTDDWP